MRLSPSDITIGQRFRSNADNNIKLLCDSIEAVGQLQPILIDSEYRLIVGERRLRACELLGIDVEATICVTLEDATKRVIAERDENHCREPWTPSEWVAIGESLEAIEKPKAAERRASQIQDGKPTGGNLPQVEEGKTRDKVAEAIGVSGKTYEKAKAVVSASKDESLPAPVREAAKEAVKQMDATGKVDPAHKAVVAAKEKEAGVTPVPSPKPSAKPPKKTMSKTQHSEIATCIDRMEAFLQRGLGSISVPEYKDAIMALRLAASKYLKE